MPESNISAAVDMEAYDASSAMQDLRHKLDEGIQDIQEGRVIDAGNAMRERRLYIACRIKESLVATDDIYTVE